MVSLQASSPLVLYKESFDILTFVNKIWESDSSRSWRRIAYVVVDMATYLSKVPLTILTYLQPPVPMGLIKRTVDIEFFWLLHVRNSLHAPASPS